MLHKGPVTIVSALCLLVSTRELRAAQLVTEYLGQKVRLGEEYSLNLWSLGPAGVLP